MEKMKTYSIHRLVAETFIPNPNNLPQVNHIDEDKANNTVENLEWCDIKYNNNYGTRNERAGKAFKIPIYCVELDKIFDSAKQASNELGLWAGNITSVCKRKLKSTGGYHFKYVKKL